MQKIIQRSENHFSMIRKNHWLTLAMLVTAFHVWRPNCCNGERKWQFS